MNNEAEVVETELLPCPFCGSHAHVRSVRIPPDSSLRAYWVECVICEVGTKYHDSERGAATTWNTRATPPTPVSTAAAESEKELRFALEGMVAAFDGEGYGDKSIIQTTRECALAVALETLGWNRPAAAPPLTVPKCVKCEHDSGVDDDETCKGFYLPKGTDRRAFRCSCKCEFPTARGKAEVRTAPIGPIAGGASHEPTCGVWRGSSCDCVTRINNLAQEAAEVPAAWAKFRNSVGFQFGFVLYSELPAETAVDHVCKAAETLFAALSATTAPTPVEDERARGIAASKRDREQRLEQLATCKNGHDTRHYYGWLADIDYLLTRLFQAETATDPLKMPLCLVHERLDQRDALEVEIGNNCIACSLHERTQMLRTLAPHVPVDGWVDSVGFLQKKLARVAELTAQVESLKLIVDVGTNADPAEASARWLKQVESVRRETWEAAVAIAKAEFNSSAVNVGSGEMIVNKRSGIHAVMFALEAAAAEGSK